MYVQYRLYNTVYYVLSAYHQETENYHSSNPFKVTKWCWNKNTLETEIVNLSMYKAIRRIFFYFL